MAGWQCGWGVLEGRLGRLQFRRAARVEMRPGKTQGDTTQFWDASNRRRPRGRSGRLTAHPCKAAATGRSGVVGKGSPRPGKAGRQTGSQSSYVSKAQGQTPEGMACCLSHWPYGRRLRLVTSCGSRVAAEAASEARAETQEAGKGAWLRGWASPPRPRPAGDTGLPLGINGPLGSQKLSA